MTLTRSHPSEAQFAARQIIQAHQNEYVAVTHDPNFYDAFSVLAQRVRTQLAAHPAIATDPLLSLDLAATRHSDTYLELLEEAGHTEASDTLHVQLHGIQPYPLDRGSNPGPLMMGGRKSHSTMRTLFGLADRSEITGLGFDAHYLPDAGLIWTGSGGVHRLLAHVIWGADVIHLPGATFRVLATPYDAALDRAYARLDVALPQLMSQVRRTRTLEPDAALAFDAFAETAPEVWQVLTAVDRRTRWPEQYHTLTHASDAIGAAQRYLAGGRQHVGDRDLWWRFQVVRPHVPFWTQWARRVMSRR